MFFLIHQELLKPAYKLQENMMNFVHSAFQDADVLVYMVEIGEKGLKDENLYTRIKNTKLPLILLLNKIDLGEQDEVMDAIRFWEKELPNAMILPISALNGFNLKEIIAKIVDKLPESPPYYDKDAITDKSERFLLKR